MIGGFRTRRLEILRADPERITDQDLAPLVTPEVTAYLPDELIATDATKPRAWLQRLMARGEVFSVETDTLLAGFLTLHPRAEDDWMLGYLFAAPAWGKGYATELIAGLCAHLRAGGWKGQLTGGVVPANAASAQVLSKTGFAKTDDAPDGIHFYRQHF